MSRTDLLNVKKRVTLSLPFIGFGITSMASISLLEIFTIIYVYRITGSVQFTYIVLAIQFLSEALLSYSLPLLLRKYTPATLLIISLPFRLAAFVILLLYPQNHYSIIGAFMLISVSSTASEIPRGVLLAAATNEKTRGLNLGLFEALRYACLALAPLFGAYAFELGGFLVVAVVSALLLGAAVAFAIRVQSDLSRDRPVWLSSDNIKIAVPFRIRSLWWITGVRYIGENSLYPLQTVILYASTIQFGWIGAAAAVAAIMFGAFADRFRGPGLLVLVLIALAGGWAMRSQPIGFEIALVVGFVCAIGGKAAGVLEKKASYDFGERYSNNVYYIARRERELLYVRFIFISSCLALNIVPSTAVLLISLAIMVILITFFVFDKHLHSY